MSVMLMPLFGLWERMQRDSCSDKGEDRGHPHLYFVHPAQLKVPTLPSLPQINNQNIFINTKNAKVEKKARFSRQTIKWFEGASPL